VKPASQEYGLQERRTFANVIRMSVVSARTYEFTVEEYQRLLEVGIFGEDDRIELLNGNLIVMPPIGIRHANAVRRILNLFARRYGHASEVDAQNPAIIDRKSEPQPDILLLRLGISEAPVKPHPQDILLLVEVADSSFIFDNSDKRDAYARNGIREYWLLDLNENRLHVFRQPAGGKYEVELVLEKSDSIAPLAFPDLPVKISQMLPPV
jgi:Uma2 family endonuclease